MAIGPVEITVVGFPGSQFSGEIAPAIKSLVDKGLIRIIDLAFIAKDDNGDVAFVEIDDLDSEVFSAFDGAATDVLGLLSEDDLAGLADALVPGSSAAAVVFEHTWAAELSSAVANSNGTVILNERIPAHVVQAALAAASA